MKISVLMAAYNGERYIYQQLESILRQTRMPDEVVICDDRSNDRTIEIIKEFNREHPELFIVLEQNKENLGYARNFFRASELSSGDMLFFSDQDDLWHPQKIEKMAECMEKNKQIGGLVCLFDVIDENSCVVKKRKTKKLKVVKDCFSGMIKTFNCGGLNFAVRRKYVEKYRDFIVNNDLSHDVPLGIIVSSYDELYRINQVFVHHRVHGGNATKPEYGIFQRLGNIEKQIKSAKNKLKWIEKCRPVVSKRISENNMRFYDSAAVYYKKTIDYLVNGNMKGLLKLCFKHNPMIDVRIAWFNVLSVFVKKIGLKK